MQETGPVIAGIEHAKGPQAMTYCKPWEAGRSKGKKKDSPLEPLEES